MSIHDRPEYAPVAESMTILLKEALPALIVLE